jgi:hypothetical protein
MSKIREVGVAHCCNNYWWSFLFQYQCKLSSCFSQFVDSDRIFDDCKSMVQFLILYTTCCDNLMFTPKWVVVWKSLFCYPVIIIIILSVFILSVLCSTLSFACNCDVLNLISIEPQMYFITGECNFHLFAFISQDVSNYMLFLVQSSVILRFMILVPASKWRLIS